MTSDTIIHHKNIRITGRVQGVGFRFWAKQVATDLGINGYVRNLPDGAVYIEAEGALPQLEAFISWCNDGPQRAIIKYVDVHNGEVLNFQNFVVR